MSVFEPARLTSLVQKAYDQWELGSLEAAPPLQSVSSVPFGVIELKWWVCRDKRGIDALAFSTHSRQSQKIFLALDFEQGFYGRSFAELSGRAVRECRGKFWSEEKQHRLGDVIAAMALSEQSLAAIKDAFLVAVRSYSSAKYREPAELPKEHPKVKRYLSYISELLAQPQWKAEKEGVDAR